MKLYLPIFGEKWSFSFGNNMKLLDPFDDIAKAEEELFNIQKKILKNIHSKTLTTHLYDVYDLTKAEKELIKLLQARGLSQEEISVLLGKDFEDKQTPADEPETPESKIEEIKRKMGYSEPKEP